MNTNKHEAGLYPSVHLHVDLRAAVSRPLALSAWTNHGTHRVQHQCPARTGACAVISNALSDIHGYSN